MFANPVSTAYVMRYIQTHTYTQLNAPMNKRARNGVLETLLMILQISEALQESLPGFLIYMPQSITFFLSILPFWTWGWVLLQDRGIQALYALRSHEKLFSLLMPIVSAGMSERLWQDEPSCV